MPERNRVTPRSHVVPSTARGALMGNRGCLHDGHTIVRPYRGTRWISCEPTYRDRDVPQWAPGRYTLLFFHDEATALTAGHRPCAQCRHHRFNDFQNAWHAAFGARSPASEMDRQLHQDRLDGPHQRRHTAPWACLPAGTFTLIGDMPTLVEPHSIRPWSDDGYGQPVPRPASGDVTVLTPRAIVSVLRAGYQPAVNLPTSPR